MLYPIVKMFNETFMLCVYACDQLLDMQSTPSYYLIWNKAHPKHHLACPQTARKTCSFVSQILSHISSQNVSFLTLPPRARRLTLHCPLFCASYVCFRATHGQIDANFRKVTYTACRRVATSLSCVLSIYVLVSHFHFGFIVLCSESCARCFLL